MADKKISALTGATTPLAGTEVLPIVQSGSTVKVAVSDLTAGRAVSMTDLTATNGLFSTSGVSVGLRDTQAYSAGAPAPTFYFQGLDSSSSNTTFGTIVGKPNVGNADRGYLNLNTRVNGVSTLTVQFGTGLSADVTINAGNLVIGTSGQGVTLPGGITWTSGSGSPEGVVTAPVGSLYSRSDGGILTSFYVKQSGSGNTGWAGK